MTDSQNNTCFTLMPDLSRTKEQIYNLFYNCNTIRLKIQRTRQFFKALFVNIVLFCLDHFRNNGKKLLVSCYLSQLLKVSRKWNTANLNVYKSCITKLWFHVFITEKLFTYLPGIQQTPYREKHKAKRYTPPETTSCPHSCLLVLVNVQSYLRGNKQGLVYIER